MPPPLDLWGHCPWCDRWYDIDTRHPDAVPWQCPACDAPPERIINRSARTADRSGRASAVLEAAGRVPPPETWHG